MKKVMAVLAVVMVLFTSACRAEDLSSLSVAELLELYQRVRTELENREFPVEAVYPDVFSGSDLWAKEMAERLEAFFYSWHVSDIPNMLTVCSSDWKAGYENADAELLRILGNRTPLDYTIMSVAEEAEDSVRSVALTVTISKNDGKEPAAYAFRITMKREADGLWYIDPRSLAAEEHEEEGPSADEAPESAEETPETADSTVLYYSPEGGQYYHADQYCRRVNDKYLPLSGMFTYAELENEAYQDLQPCDICGAPPRRAE